jgi:dienelactone hydrolase
MLAESYYGGGEFNEIYRTCHKIVSGDTESWHLEWRRTADRVRQYGRGERAGGRSQSALKAFFRASNYYRVAEFFLSYADERKVPTYLESVGAFQEAVEITTRMERVEVPYENTHMPGYLFLPEAPIDNPPVLILTGGADSTAEEVYFIGASEATRRGLACLIVDGPGRGGMLRLQKSLAVPDFERPVKAMVDYLEARGDVDSNRIALMGVSMGGYYMTRAAAYEKRVRACVCHFGPYNAYTDIYQFYDPLKAQFRWITGSSTEDEVKERLSQFTLEGSIGRVECPLLILHGADDMITDPRAAQRIYDEARCEKELRFMQSGDPGAIHCSYDNHAEIFPFMHDWVAARI